MLLQNLYQLGKAWSSAVVAMLYGSRSSMPCNCIPDRVYYTICVSLVYFGSSKVGFDLFDKPIRLNLIESNRGWRGYPTMNPFRYSLLDGCLSFLQLILSNRLKHFSSFGHKKAKGYFSDIIYER